MNDDVTCRDTGVLDYLSVIRFSGPEAAKFLQGQISQDTERLSGGFPLLASFNSPQGRVLSVLTLLPHRSGIIGIVPRNVVAATIESLRKYILRAKVKIEDASEIVRIAGAGGHAALGALKSIAPSDGRYGESDGVGVARLGASDDRYWVIAESNALQAAGVGAAHTPATREMAWRLADIRAGRPQIYSPTRELFVAQMLNLDLIDGISFSKGCYTGQEIIARTQHLGRIKRRMFRLGLPAGECTVGQNLLLQDGRSGRIVESAFGLDGHEVLAVLPLDKSTDPDSATPSTSDVYGGVPVKLLPLPY